MIQGALEVHEGLDVANHPVESVHPANLQVGLPGRRVHGNPVLVQPALDQPAGSGGREGDRVGIEQDRRSLRLQVRDHREQLRVEERLPDPVEDDPVEGRELFHDPRELGEGEILGRLQGIEGAGAGPALRVAPVRGLEVERARQRGDDSRPFHGPRARKRRWCKRSPPWGDRLRSHAPSPGGCARPWRRDSKDRARQGPP